MKSFLLRFLPILIASLMEAAAASPTPKEPVEALERVFRQESIQELRRLVSRGEKVYVSSPSLGFEDGYYSGDQVCLVIQEVFRSRITVRFNFLKGTEHPAEVSRIAAVARWTYRTGKSKDRTVEIAFTLIRRDGGWILKEIRDVS